MKQMAMKRHSTTTKRDRSGSSENAEKRPRRSWPDTMGFLRAKLNADQETKMEERQIANIAQTFQNFQQIQSEQNNQTQQQMLLILQQQQQQMNLFLQK